MNVTDPYDHSNSYPAPWFMKLIEPGSEKN